MIAKKVDEFVVLVEMKYTILCSTNIKKFLGLKIEHFPNGFIQLSQPQQIEDMMNEYKLVDIPLLSVPMPSTF